MEPGYRKLNWIAFDADEPMMFNIISAPNLGTRMMKINRASRPTWS